MYIPLPLQILTRMMIIPTKQKNSAKHLTIKNARWFPSNWPQISSNFDSTSSNNKLSLSAIWGFKASCCKVGCFFGQFVLTRYKKCQMVCEFLTWGTKLDKFYQNNKQFPGNVVKKKYCKLEAEGLLVWNILWSLEKWIITRNNNFWNRKFFKLFSRGFSNLIGTTKMAIWTNM